MGAADPRNQGNSGGPIVSFQPVVHKDSTAGGGGPAKIVSNGPFDPRIAKLRGLANSPGFHGNELTRGYIIQQKPVGGTRYKCGFLYNPSTVTVTHAVDANVISNQDAVNPNDVTAGQLLMPLQQSISFSLLFDRTYELWDDSKMSGETKDGVNFYGVGWDVQSLYRITGVASPLDVVKAQGDGGGTAAASAFSQGKFQSGAVGPMLYVPVFAVFGNFLDYYGVIQEMDIQYTHWTQFMVPSRCQVNISMTLLPRSNGNKANPRPAGPTGNGIPGMPSGADFNNPSILNPANNGKGGR